MFLYCLKCSKKANSKNPKVAWKNKEKLMILSKCAVCDTKKLRITKEEEGSGLLSSLGIKTAKIFLVGPILF